MSKTIRNRTTRSIRDSTRSRRIRACTSGELGPSASISFPTRPDSGPKKPAPARNVTAKSTSPITIQSSPKSQNSALTTKPTPVRNAPRAKAVRKREAIHSTSSVNCASRSALRDARALSPKNCIIAPPPIQSTAKLMCRKSQRSYQVKTGSEELLELHRGAHVAVDLELPGHVGGRGILLTARDRLERLLGGVDRHVAVGGALRDLDGSVGQGPLPRAVARDLEDVRVVHAGGVGRVDTRLEGLEELAGLHRAASLPKGGSTPRSGPLGADAAR